MKKQIIKYYHYTSTRYLCDILRIGMIVPDDDPQMVNEGLSVVWVSAMSPWDPICRATLELEPDDWEHLRAGTVPGAPFEAARIQVDGTVTEPWDNLLVRSGAGAAAIFQLAQVGYEYDSDPEKWRASPNPLSCRSWMEIQLWDGEDWIPLPRHGEFYAITDLELFISDIPGIMEVINENE